jgi:hypothetical protein
MTGAAIAKRCLLAVVLLLPFAVAANAATAPPRRVHKLGSRVHTLDRRVHKLDRRVHKLDSRVHKLGRRVRTIERKSQQMKLRPADPPPIVIGVDNLSSQAGWAVVRQDACWECTQPAPGTWNWSYDDALHRQLGSRWLPILDYAPKWAGGGMSWFCFLGGAVFDEAPPTDIGAYAAFARAFVERYHPSTVEVWNEPDVPMMMDTPNPGSVYRRMYLAAYNAIKRASPHTKVLLAGDDESNGDWFLPSLAGVPTDGVSAHPYATTPAGVATLVHHDEQLLPQLHIKAPLYLTEVGLTGVYCTTPSIFLEIVSALAGDPDIRQIDAYLCPPNLFTPHPLPPGVTCPSSPSAGVSAARDARPARLVHRVRLRARR